LDCNMALPIPPLSCAKMLDIPLSFRGTNVYTLLRTQTHLDHKNKWHSLHRSGWLYILENNIDHECKKKIGTLTFFIPRSA
jgi:hypothetical protein